MGLDKYRSGLSELADKQAIATVLAVHSRGIDRADADLLKSAYHPDADVNYGMFVGPAAEFADIVTNAVRGGPATLHRPCNTWIAVDGDRARAESYVIAYMGAPGEEGGSATQILIGGRYLDRLERRSGEWRLTHRTYVLDWNINQPSESLWTEAMTSIFKSRGGHGADDPGNRLLASFGQGNALTSDKGSKGMTSDNALDTMVDAVLSKQALHELTMAYCRGVDRCDVELLKSVWHPDATVDAGVFKGNGLEFSEFITGALAAQDRPTFHSVANEWFDIRGDVAVGESYMIGVNTPNDDGSGLKDSIVGGRYVDRFERRDGVWKIAHRSFVMDWNINQPSTAIWDEGMYATLKVRGGRKPDDPVYAFWNS